MENKDITLFYWKIRGLGCGVASLLEHMKVPFNYTYYTDRESWKTDKAKLIDNGFLNPNLPYIEDKSANKKISETFAVLYYLANKYKPDLVPKTNDEVTQMLVVKGIITDYNSAITRPAYTCKSLDEMKKTLKGSMRFHSSKTNYWKVILEKNPWVMGDKLSFLDFYLAELIEKLIVMQEELEEEFINADALKVFKEYVARFTALEGVKEFRESEKFLKRPFNNVPKAVWG